MNRITFCGGESTGSVADRKIETAKQESTGGVAVKSATAKHESTGGVAARIYHQDPELKMETLDRDTVSFRGKEADEPILEPKMLTISLIIDSLKSKECYPNS